VYRYTAFILNLSTSCRWIVSFTSRPLLPRGNTTHPLFKRLGGPHNMFHPWEKRKISCTWRELNHDFSLAQSVVPILTELSHLVVCNSIRGTYFGITYFYSMPSCLISMLNDCVTNIYFSFFLYCLLLSHSRHSREGSTLASYLAGSVFESRPWCRIYWLRFPSADVSLSRKILGLYSNVRLERLQSNNFPLIIHQPSRHSAPHILRHPHRLYIKHK
jgi:hypothetical protein